MTAADWTDALAAMRPCADAFAWARTQPDYETAWRTCERGDWMLWLAGRVSCDLESDARRRLVLAACECARLSLRHVPDGEVRPLRAIETAEAWARREDGVTMEQVREAAYAAYAACTAKVAATYAAAEAADAAAYTAAYAAYAAAYTAAYAAYAAAEAAYAEAACAAAVARSSTLRACADIMRRHYPEPPEIAERISKEGV